MMAPVGAALSMLRPGRRRTSLRRDTRDHVAPCNIEGAVRTRATRLPSHLPSSLSPLPCALSPLPFSLSPLPSLLYPLLLPILVPYRSRPWILLETDAASFLAGCQEAFVGPCSYFAPLQRSALLSPADLAGVHRSRPRTLPRCRGSGARTRARSGGWPKC